MEKRIVRLTESDLEKLVKRIIKEEGEESEPIEKRISSSDLSKQGRENSRSMGGLTGQENIAVQKLNAIINKLKGSSNEVTGTKAQVLGRLFKEFGV